MVWPLLRMVWFCMMMDGMVMIEDGRMGVVAMIEDGTVWCCMMLDGMVMIENGRVGDVAYIEDGMLLYDDGRYGHK